MLTFPLLCYFVTDQESPLYNNGRLYLLIVAEVQIRSNVHFSPVCSSVQCNEVQIRFPLFSSVLHCTVQQYKLQCNAMNSLMKTSCTTNVALCFSPVHCKLYSAMYNICLNYAAVQCSAAHWKVHPFALNCSFQIVHSSALHFVWGATFLSWTDGKWDLIEIAAEIQNRFRIGGNIWLRFPPCSYKTPSSVRNTVALGYEGNTVV